MGFNTSKAVENICMRVDSLYEYIVSHVDYLTIVSKNPAAILEKKFTTKKHKLNL